MQRHWQVGTLLASAGALYALPAAAGIPVVTRRITSGQPAGDATAIRLTFDDGPHPDGTAAVLDLLGEFGASATFFVVAEQVIRYPDLCRCMVAAGHEVALHGWDHRCLLRVGPAATVRQIARGAEVVADVTGQRPTRYRPPYGVFSLPAMVACRRVGLTPTWWTAWGRDWSRHATARSVLALVGRGVAARSPATVLLHDSDCYGTPGSWRTTVAATRLLLREWADAGRAVTALRDAGPPRLEPAAAGRLANGLPIR